MHDLKDGFDDASITVPPDIDMQLVLGASDELLHYFQDNFNTRISVRGNVIALEGDPVEVQLLTAQFCEIVSLVQDGIAPDLKTIRHSLTLTRLAEYSPSQLRADILHTYRGRAIRPKTAGQKRYVDAIRSKTITFATGPAGTGKTYLAVAMALAALEAKEVGRIVLSRPIVEAGENLGFLPGTLTEKVDPYIRPLYDALYDMVDATRANQLISNGTIEIAPLAFMRGRTLSDSFVVLDEAQNTTPDQMKMFLTRLGFGSKMVITGDATQTDLGQGISGLLDARRVLKDVADIAFCDFNGTDVVRNPLVADIVSAYGTAHRKG